MFHRHLWLVGTFTGQHHPRCSYLFMEVLYFKVLLNFNSVNYSQSSSASFEFIYEFIASILTVVAIVFYDVMLFLLMDRDASR